MPTSLCWSEGEYNNCDKRGKLDARSSFVVNNDLYLLPPLPLPKAFWLRALELLVLYCLVGTVGIAFERLIGNVFTQRWEFYAITLSLFVVMAFPGFVFRYLLRRA